MNGVQETTRPNQGNNANPDNGENDDKIKDTFASVLAQAFIAQGQFSDRVGSNELKEMIQKLIDPDSP